MANIQLLGTIVPKNSGDFAIANNSDIMGGVKIVDGYAAALAIPAARRQIGMLVFSYTDGYFLKLNTDQTNWTLRPDIFGSSTANAVKLQGFNVSPTTPLAGEVLTWDNTNSVWKPAAGVDVRTKLNGSDSVGGYLSDKLKDGYGISFVENANSGNGYFTANLVPTGDISRTNNTSTLVVTALQGNAVATQVLGATTDGYALTWAQADGYWKAKKLPTQDPVMAGDVTGTASSNTVTKIQGHAVNATAPSDGQVLVWNAGDGYYAPGASFTPGGDLYGTVSTQLVSQLTGAADTKIVTVPPNVVLGFDGYIHLQAGIGEAYLKAGDESDVTIQSGAGTSYGAAGDVNIIAGNASGAGGNVIISAGNGSTDGNIELNTDSTGVVTINSDKVLAQHVISPAALTGNENDYEPTNWAKCSVIRLSSVDGYNITGFGSITTNGILMKTIFNVGSHNITLKNNDSGSITSNKIIIPGGFNFVLEPNDSVGIFYDTITVDGVWRLC